MTQVGPGGEAPRLPDEIGKVDIKVEEEGFSVNDIQLSIKDATRPNNDSLAKKAGKVGSDVLKGVGFGIGGLGFCLGVGITATVFILETVFAIIVFKGGTGSNIRLFSGIGYHSGRATALILGAIGAKMQGVDLLKDLMKLEKLADIIIRNPSLNVPFVKPLDIIISKDPYREKKESDATPDYSTEADKRGANLELDVQEDDKDSS